VLHEQTEDQQATPSTLDIHYMLCEADDKLNQLLHFLKQQQTEAPCKFIVYFSTCASVDYFGYGVEVGCAAASCGRRRVRAMRGCR
jgi:ATP-dependent RNA helicase DDX55/SPB4